MGNAEQITLQQIDRKLQLYIRNFVKKKQVFNLRRKAGPIITQSPFQNVKTHFNAELNGTFGKENLVKDF